MALPQEPTAEALTPKGLEPSVREAAPVVKHILWVDDHPDNNRSLRQWMATRLNVEFEICLYTAEALRKMNPSIDLVISDMSRPVEGDPQAGITLLQELKRLEYNKPYLIYASRILPDQEQRFKGLGGYAVTSSPVQLMALVEQALKS
jgi:CheY-like chemotaxis protein